MFKTLCLCAATLALASCGSLRGPHQQYTAPAISGRVLDDATDEPIQGARVARVQGREEDPTVFPKTGAERLTEDRAVRTAADGWFYLPAQRSAYLLFGPSGSLSATLRVEKSGYLNVTTNLDFVRIKPVKTSKGPEIQAGDLRMRRVP